MEKRYSISDASKQVLVENHVLRYWEEELEMNIARNSQGHRYYTERDISVLKAIKDLKEQGFQLKAIKIVLPDIDRVRSMHPQELYKLREELNQRVQREEEMQRVIPLKPAIAEKTEISEKTSEEKLRKFEIILRNLVKSVVEENEKEREEIIYEKVSTKMMKEMDYMMRQKEEIHEKEIALLKQILNELKHEIPDAEAAASLEPDVLDKRERKHKKGRRRKLFAKSTV